ncbi:MAG: putative ABC transporter permease subunit [Bacillota bacterium]
MSASLKGLRRSGLRSPFMSLLAIQFRVEFGLRGISEKLGLGRRGRSALVYLIAMGLALMPLMSMLYKMGDSIAAQSIMIGQPGLLPIMAVMLGQFLVLFVGLSALMSTLYYAADIETLLAMPLTGRQILGAKVLVAYVVQLGISAAVVIPFLVPLGLRLGSLIFWPLAVLIVFLIPAIPLALGLLATVLIMRATTGARHRDTMRVILGLVFFLIIVAFQYFNSAMLASGPEEVMRALTQPNGLVQLAAGYYPPLKWAAWALTGWATGTGLFGTVAFAGGSLLALFGVLTITQGWFLGGLGDHGGTAKARRGVGARGRDAGWSGAGRLNEAKEAGVTGAGSGTTLQPGLFSKQLDPSSAVSLRDHRVLTRTPNFLLVVLTNLALVPLLWVFGAVGGGELRALIGGASGFPVETIILIFVLVQGGLASMNQVSSTSISREGATFWLSKMIPVPPSVQVRAKLRYSLGVAAIQLVTLVAAAYMIFGLSAYHLAVTAILGMLASWPVSAICVINDLHNPRLKWTQPHQAMKGNLMTVGAMALSAVYLWVCAMGVGLMRRAGLSGAPLYVVVAAIAVGSGFLLQRYMERLADRRYRAIEA